MEGVEASDSDGVLTMSGDYGNSESYHIQESENVGSNILEDLDSYLEDINERLTISRMVSNSVIKGIVNAVSLEAAEKVAAKELEVAELKEALHYHRRDCGEFGPPQPLETLCVLTEATKEQLESLGHYVEHQNVPEGTNVSSDMIKAFHSLKATVEAMCQEVGVTMKDWILEQQIREEVESIVFSTILQSMQDDYERCLMDVNGVLCSVDRFKEILNVRQELSSIQKCLGGPEHMHGSPEWSQESDHFHPKDLSSHELPSGSLWDRSGRCMESRVGTPEDLETSKLKHMNHEELCEHFRNLIAKLKREHETTVEQMTDQYFALRRQSFKERQLLKERGFFATSKKDKDFEMVRKNISDVILKLDDIIADNEKVSDFCKRSERRLDAILSENCHFRDLINNQKLELDSLILQASQATEKLSQYSVVEENLRKLVGHLEKSLEDAHMKASLGEDVYKCILRDVASQANFDNEDLEMNSTIMQEITSTVYEEAVHDAEIALRSDYEDTYDLESTLLQQVHVIVFREILKELSIEFSELKKKNLKDNERLAFFENKAFEIEKALQREVGENNILKHQISELENSIEMKDQSLLQVTGALEETRQQLELAEQELRKLTVSTTELQSLIHDRDKEVVSLKDQIAELEKQVHCCVTDMGKLNEKLELSENKLRKAEEEKAMFISGLEQERNASAVLKTKDREYMKQMESVGHVLKGLSKSFCDFERTTTERIRWHNVRLENSAFQLHSLVPKINNLRRTRQLYKEWLDKRCSDLQKAEAEVDLLGDEVDSLLRLLEKIYVALDHYSPILQHYPGIMETLKLIRRELSAEPLKVDVRDGDGESSGREEHYTHPHPFLKSSKKSSPSPSPIFGRRGLRKERHDAWGLKSTLLEKCTDRDGSLFPCS